VSRYVIVHGNVSTGIEEIIGPFENLRRAVKWVKDNGLEDSPYHPLRPLTIPAEIEEREA
jgi:hypothetical protein